jgi:predicted dehydrogenase
MTLRIGVIGAGTHGARYTRHARQDVPGLEPVVLCRRDREQGETLAQEWNCRFESDAEAVIHDPDVDALVVCTPPSTHFPLARAVLESGKPLLLEKPMTGTYVEAVALQDLDSKSSAPPLMVAQTLRWNPVVQKAKELWPLLGRVHMVRLAQRLAPTQLAWQRDLAQSVGGSVLLTGVHMFDMARYLTGREIVSVDSRQRHIQNPVTEDHFLTRAVMDDGCWCTFEVSKYTQSRACWLEAVGEEGQLLADYMFGGIRLLRGSYWEAIPADAMVPTLPPVLTAWEASVREGTVPPVTVYDGLQTLAVVKACYRSHREGREITLSELKT